MLETALIFLPMMAMYFGILDLALSVFIQSTFNSAVRAGTRFAVVFNSSLTDSSGVTSCASSQATCVIQAVQDNASGFLSGTKAQYIWVRYYTANDLGTPVMSCQGGSACTLTGVLPQTLTNGKIVQYPNQPGNVVEVAVVGFPLQWMVPIRGLSAGTGISLGSTSSDVLGGLASGSIPPNP